MMKPAASGQKAASADKSVYWPEGWTKRKPRPADRTGPCGGRPSVAVLARPRPEQGVAFAAYVVEQVRVDRCVEGRIVKLERKVVAAFLGALRPGCADLGPAHVDAVAGGVLVGAVGFCDDADAPGLQNQSDE